MKVLWISNIIFPELQSILNNTTTELSASGGWMLGAGSRMADENGIQLYVACPGNVDRLTHVEGKKIHYYLFKGPMVNDWPWNDDIMRELIENVNPELIHIWGLEYCSAISALRVADGRACVVSLQGFLHKILPHERDGLSCSSRIMLNGFSLRKIYSERKNSYQRSAVEIKALQLAQNVIGRTDWDKKVSCEVNPHLKYFHCDEVMRSEFYDGEWNYEFCERHSLFHSNGTVPNKGLHEVLKAMPNIIKKYPDTKLYVAGGIVPQMAQEGNNYSKIIIRLLKTLKLEKCVFFCGNMTATQMREKMLKTNIFLLTSAMENSSNALCEAQLLGVPIVASDRGGTPSLIPNSLCGSLYKYGDTKQLEREICNIFAQGDNFDNAQMINIARNRHDPQKNQDVLMNIYREILVN